MLKIQAKAYQSFRPTTLLNQSQANCVIIRDAAFLSFQALPGSALPPLMCCSIDGSKPHSHHCQPLDEGQAVSYLY